MSESETTSPTTKTDNKLPKYIDVQNLLRLSSTLSMDSTTSVQSPERPHRKTRAENITGLSRRALIATSFEYCINDLRKKYKQFLMSAVTVFLTVAFITFLDCMCQISSVPSMKMAIGMSGDFDMVLMAESNRRLQSMYKPRNYFVDEYEGFE